MQPRLALLRRRTARPARRRGRGQALVEFSLVFTIFVTMLMGFIEFAFMFNALLSIGHATRDAALIAAEAGDNTGADCAILAQVEKDVSAPADPSRITQVVIYRADQNGAVIGSQQNVYLRTGSTTCTMSDLSTVDRALHDLRERRATPQPAGAISNWGARMLPTRSIRSASRSSTSTAWVTPLANLVSLGGTGHHPDPVERHADGACPVSAGRSNPRREESGRIDEAGQSLVEFSFVVPVFLLLLLGMLEFGFAFEHDQTIAYATPRRGTHRRLARRRQQQLRVQLDDAPGLRRPDHRRSRARARLARVADRTCPRVSSISVYLTQGGRDTRRRTR